MYAGRLERIDSLDGVAAGHVDGDLVVLDCVGEVQQNNYDPADGQSIAGGDGARKSL